MRAGGRTGLSLVAVLASDLLVSALAQLVIAFRGDNAGSPPYSFVFVSLLSLVVVIPAWVAWQPVIFFLDDPLHRRRALFVGLGVLWGPLVTYSVRIHSLVLHPALWLAPNLFDGLALAVSSLATGIYLSLLRHGARDVARRRIQSN